MAKQMKFVFKRVNGDKTGSYCRTGKSSSYSSPGILYMVNCPDGKSFYCDPEDKNDSNTYYRLINPTDYNLPDQTMYVYVDDSFISSRTIVDENRATPGMIIPPTEAVEQPVVNKKQEVAVANLTPYLGKPTDYVDPSGTGVSTASKTTKAEIPKPLVNPPNIYSYGSITRNSFLNDYTYMKESLATIESNLNISMSSTTAANLKSDIVNKFNRFRLLFPDLELSKAFAQVFFTRPDLNLADNVQTATKSYTLTKQAYNDPVYYYLWKTNPDLLLSLTKSFTSSHDFNPFLSNMAQSFELADEYIESIEYGETFTGYKVKYGKSNIKSKTAGSFSINYTDDIDYKIYKIHKAWVDYISKVFRGEFIPKSDYVRYRTIDYAVSVYYFLCGPDGETILFWTKYTGVFPTNIPSAASSWSKGNNITKPDYSINYEYAFKEDFNPITLGEFNQNSYNKNFDYAKIYEPELVSTGKTFTGAPYVEKIKDKAGKYVYKLRFRKS